MTDSDTKRVALLGMHLEANGFAPVSRRADFEALCYLVGEEITAEAAQPHPAMPMEVPGFVRAMNESGPWEPVPILLTAAGPGGPVEQAFLEEILAECRHRLRQAMPLDGVYIANHGAMAATEALDPEADFYRMVREVVGPETPLVGTLDLHANVSQDMVALVDVLIAYRKNPHTDQPERGAEAARALREMFAGVRPATAFLSLPVSAQPTTLLTAEGPYAELIDYGQSQLTPDILNVSVLGGFAYADTPTQGLSVVVTVRGDQGAARRVARDIAARAWENRRRFVKTFTSLEDAVALAKRTGDDAALPPILLADVADNPGGGGRSNTTWLLEALYRAGAQGVLLGNFFDQALARRAHELGEGAACEAAFNSGEAHPFSRKITLPARVVRLGEGTFVGRRGIAKDRTISLGRCAALQVGGVTVVVGSERRQCADPMYFEFLGIDPGQARTVVVKSRGHFRAGFDEFFPPERIIEVDTQGLTSQNLWGFPYKHLSGGMFPFDEDVVWEPPEWARR